MDALKSKGRIAIVGAGLVGSGWPTIFARAGFDVSLFDSAPGDVECAYGLDFKTNQLVSRETMK